MLKRVFYHIGLPKTGTTALQLNYFPFLTGGVEFISGHTKPMNPIVSNLLSYVRKGQIEDESMLNAMIESAGYSSEFILISAEHIATTWLGVHQDTNARRGNFSSLDSEEVLQRLKLFHQCYFGSEVECSILIGVRDFPKLIMSMYAQFGRIKYFENTNSFDRFLTYVESNPQNYSLPEMVERIEQMFDSVLVYHQEELMESTDRLNAFFKGYGIQTSVKAIDRENVRAKNDGQYKLRHTPRPNWVLRSLSRFAPQKAKRLVREKILEPIFESNISYSETQRTRLETLQGKFGLDH